jgi:hypothetical protein
MIVGDAPLSQREREPPICALVHVDCLVTADVPNGLIRIGQQLAA